jgi:transcriptional regulator with XRE-family HTH domain
MTDRRTTRTDPRRLEFARRLQTARLAKGLTQHQTAELLGVSRQYITDLEAGRRIESWPAWLHMVSTLDYPLETVAPELVAKKSRLPETDTTQGHNSTRHNRKQEKP